MNVLSNQTSEICTTFRERAKSLAEAFRARPIVRTMNFHNTSRQNVAEYDQKLAYCSQFFSSVDEDELEEYVITGIWRKPKPGLIVAVYEGYRNNFDVLAPLLERHGFCGWFFIIPGFINTPVEEQITFAEGHRIWMRAKDYGNNRHALTWDEVRELNRKHVIASHTRTHVRLALLDQASQEREIVGAQQDLEQQLGHKVRAFASLTGVAYGEYPEIDRLVLAAGYDFVFSSSRIQRVGRRRRGK